MQHNISQVEKIDSGYDVPRSKQVFSINIFLTWSDLLQRRNNPIDSSNVRTALSGGAETRGGMACVRGIRFELRRQRLARDNRCRSARQDNAVSKRWVLTCSSCAYGAVPSRVHGVVWTSQAHIAM
jgi:hypothetical protein